MAGGAAASTFSRSATRSESLFDLARDRGRHLADRRCLLVSARDDVFQREVDRAGEEEDVASEARDMVHRSECGGCRDERGDERDCRQQRHEVDPGQIRRRKRPGHEVGGHAHRGYDARAGDGQSKHPEEPRTTQWRSASFAAPPLRRPCLTPRGGC